MFTTQKLDQSSTRDRDRSNIKTESDFNVKEIIEFLGPEFNGNNHQNQMKNANFLSGNMRNAKAPTVFSIYLENT